MTDPAVYCDDRGWACIPVLNATANERIAAVAGWLSQRPLTILAIILVAWVTNRILRRLIQRTGNHMMAKADQIGEAMPNRFRRKESAGRAAARGEAISTVARSIATSIVVLGASAAILSELGVSLAALVASAGVIGVALGFGAQNLVRDMLAGWFIVVEDRYGVGDTIDAGAPAVGVVERITLRSTRLRDINGIVWHVDNGEVVRVGNKTQNWSRAVIDVVVTPQTDVDLACELLEQVGLEMREDPLWASLFADTPPHVLGVYSMNPTGITLRVHQDTEPSSQFEVELEYRRRVLSAFESAGICQASAMPTMLLGPKVVPTTTEGTASPGTSN
ncbi:MAG: mechanosensitive ion channel domain-containing protein [Microthrixaceae bacterium]